MNMKATIAIVGFFLALLITIALLKYIRDGDYRRLPVGRGDEDWFETPARLRLPPVASCGFAITSIFAVLFSYIRIDIFHHMEKSMGGLSVVLCLVLFLIERNSPQHHGLGFKRGSVAAAFCLGVAVAFALYSLIFSAFSTLE